MVYTPTWFLSVSHFTSLSLRFGVSDLSVSHFTSLSLRFGVSDFVCLSLAWSVRFRASLNQASLRFGVSDVGWVFHSGLSPPATLVLTAATPCVYPFGACRARIPFFALFRTFREVSMTEIAPVYPV